MRLLSVKLGPFRSIDIPQTVLIDEATTVLVGMNEAGKTVFLQGLLKSRDALGQGKFEPVEDYPRKRLTAYGREHESNPSEVVTLTFQLTDVEVDTINEEFGTALEYSFQFSVTTKYNNKRTVGLHVDESPVVAQLAKTKGLSKAVLSAFRSGGTIHALHATLQSKATTDQDKALLKNLDARVKDAQPWTHVVASEIWKFLERTAPRFVYFSDYDLLPGKVNLKDLGRRYSKSSNLEPRHRSILALLRMADIEIEDFTNPGSYEELKAKIEAVSINLTDQIMEFWKQNEDLEVEIDIKEDAQDEPPFNDGPNLYLRIRNRRHRGMTTSFQQRSRGFVWFFSFLVWFDSIQYQVNDDVTKSAGPLILLLDEPGLALHALAQADFLRYISDLSTRHQVIYTTHSPFMVDSQRLHQVRVVEDVRDKGTVISEDVSGMDRRTTFPLQAALGWTIAQNLFISRYNLLAEGPSELLYLKTLSLILESKGRVPLRNEITIVPVGGLDKVVTFIALLGASGLEMVVLHDFKGAPEQKLDELVREKIIKPKFLLNPSQFRDVENFGKNGKASDIEDMFEISEYLGYFNATFSDRLKGTRIKVGDLPPGDRIVNRIERFLASNDIQLRPSGGFNHYAVASHFSVKPPAKLNEKTLARFEALFQTVNNLLSTP